MNERYRSSSKKHKKRKIEDDVPLKERQKKQYMSLE